MNMRTESGFSGFLWIGDPHASSTRPGRRTDDYETAILRKLAASAEIARAENLFPIFAGDLLHRAAENNLRLLNRLAAVLAQFPVRPLTLEGNHDKSQTQVSESDALALLAAGRHVQVADTVGFAVRVEGVARIFCVPYGADIPDSVADEGVDGDEPIVMLTHHDLAFNGAYPGAALLKEVAGVPLAINGHMHKNLPSAKLGGTVWQNPGNIARVNVDDRDHKPRAWKFTLGAVELTPVDLPFEAEVFDLTGVKKEAPVVTAAAATSLFSQMLAADVPNDPLAAAKSDDGSILMEDLQAAAEGLHPAALAVVTGLLAKAVASAG